MNDTSSTPHIAIIGCGVSGLRCADILLQKRCKVTMLEARDRIGGRIHQIETGGHLVGLGANWIHEPKDNPILELAKLSSTVMFERPAQQATFDRHGKPFDNEVAVRLKTTLWDRFAGNGSYSNPQVGMKDAYGDVEALQSGCRFGEEQGVWLSGEHTASPCRMGTTTGAYGSGERMARRIREIRGLRYSG